MGRKPLAIDLFAGAGGITEGLRMAGFSIPLASDADKNVEIIYCLNHKSAKFICKPIEKLTGSQIKAVLRERGYKLDDVDLLTGGPPCQGFSIIGHRDPLDYRNGLISQFVRIIRETRPKAFAMENVFGILSFQGGKLVRRLVRKIEKLGYHVTVPEVLNAASYGVPQFRRRVFFIGVRTDILDKALTYPKPVRGQRVPESNQADSIGLLPSGNGLLPFFTVRDAISDLPAEIAEDGEPLMYPPADAKILGPYQIWARSGNTGLLCSHHTKKAEALRTARIEALKEGQTGSVLPEHLRAGGHDNKYRRLNWENPSPTVTAHISKDLSDFIHPEYNRWLTVREAARLQSFPDKYIFSGSEFQQLKHVGNAVPPIFAAAVFYHIGKELGLDVCPPPL